MTKRLPPAVTLAYVHDVEVAHSFHDSLVNLLMFDAANDRRVLRGGYIAMRYGTGGIIAARNEIAKRFLDQPAEWLFILDSDMGFEAESLERLLEVADPVTRPIVGGLCFAQKETARDGMSGFRCAPRVTILDWIRTEAGEQFAGRSSYPINSVVQCSATGSACILIHRSVLERIAAESGPVWYDRIPDGAGGLFGEDVSFCIRAGAFDFPVHVHTGVKTTHLKNLWLAEADFWRAIDVPPATQPTAVIVPVMGRPQNAAPFMASLRASTGLATVYAIVNDDGPPGSSDVSTWDAWRDAGAVVMSGQDGETTFAQKVNLAYNVAFEPWLFLVGDDVRFHPGWLDHAQHAAGDTYDVVGTNDLANPRVTNGEHATHMLIRRSYIDEHGASWDGPKVVAHEGYRHWYVDDEIVTAAKQRGVWAMALGSLVEHLHPMVGKAETDSVYELGQSSRNADRALFERRSRANAR
jgi:hypothetical protein